jgi:uncharacterized metal-binding protein YceD (DUF177 family)
VRLHQLGRGAIAVRLEPDAAERAKVAHDLGLESLPTLTAELAVRPWLDGAEITGRFEAVVEQLCSVSLDAFEQSLRGEIEVRVLPAGSSNAPTDEGLEGEHDPEAPDPPDVLAGDAVDLAAFVVEHLALEIDPFARKPGEEFAFDTPPEPHSPFAVLKKLKGEGP